MIISFRYFFTLLLSISNFFLLLTIIFAAKLVYLTYQYNFLWVKSILILLEGIIELSFANFKSNPENFYRNLMIILAGIFIFIQKFSIYFNSINFSLFDYFWYS